MMKRVETGIAIVAAALLVPVAVPQAIAGGATSTAETACMTKINSNYGGKVARLDVVSADYSEAGTVVIVDADGERWRCLSSNGGTVEDLSVIEGAARSGTGQQQTADLVGMRARNLDGEMERRGFRNAGGYKSGGAAFTTWWNADTRQCLSVETRDGRVAQIESIVEGNCL